MLFSQSQKSDSFKAILELLCRYHNLQASFSLLIAIIHEIDFSQVELGTVVLLILLNRLLIQVLCQWEVSLYVVNLPHYKEEVTSEILYLFPIVRIFFESLFRSAVTL